MVGSVFGVVCTSIFKRLLIPLLPYKVLLLYGSNDGTRLSETIFFFWTMSVFLTVNRPWRLGNWLCFHVRMKREETPNLVGPLGTTNSLYKLRQCTKSKIRRLFRLCIIQQHAKKNGIMQMCFRAGSKLMSVEIFKPKPLNSWGKKPWCPLDRLVDESNSWYECWSWTKKNLVSA